MTKMTQKRELKRTRRLKRTNSKKHQFRRYGRTRTRTRTHTRVKRGGMFSRAGTLANTVRETVGTVLVHDIKPFFTQYNQYIAGINPKPEDGYVVINGDKFFESFADIPIDPDIKASIHNFKEELKNPPQTFDKAVTTFKNLITILDDRKKQLDKENIKPPGDSSHLTPVFKPSSSSLSSPLSTLSLAGNTTQSPRPNLGQYIQEPFTSPFKRKSTVVSTTTPPNLPVGATRADQGDQSQLFSPIQRRLTLDNEDAPVDAAAHSP
jgi:hypothetical protein